MLTSSAHLRSEVQYGVTFIFAVGNKTVIENLDGGIIGMKEGNT